MKGNICLYMQLRKYQNYVDVCVGMIGWYLRYQLWHGDWIIDGRMLINRLPNNQPLKWSLFGKNDRYLSTILSICFYHENLYSFGEKLEIRWPVWHWPGDKILALWRLVGLVGLRSIDLSLYVGKLGFSEKMLWTIYLVFLASFTIF